MSMIRYVYRSSTKPTITQQEDNIFYDNIDSYSEVNSLIHKWDAYTQRLNYDAQKRHERYIRDRDAGKTGYLGGRRINTGLKYRTSTSAPSGRKRTENPGPKQEQPQAEQPASKGSGRSSGSGRSQADQEEMARIKNDIAAIREASAEAKAKLRENAKAKIEELREELKEKSEAVKEAIEKDREEKKLERENAKEQSKIDIETAKDNKESNIEKDSKKLKDELDSDTNPIREKIAKLRGRLDSISDPQEIVKLKTQILNYNENINERNQKYTESLSEMKTEHTTKMRAEITKIRNDLKDYLNKSKQEQKENAEKNRQELKTMREENNEAIKKIRAQLKEDIATETQNAKESISKIKSGDADEIYRYNPVQRQYESKNRTTTDSMVKDSDLGITRDSKTGNRVVGTIRKKKK